MHKRKLTVVFWEGYIDVAPTLIALVDKFSSEGWLVDLVLGDSNPGNLVKKEGVTIRKLTREKTLAERLLDNKIGHRLFGSVTDRVSAASASDNLARFSEFLGYESCDIALCVDATGLVALQNSGIRASKKIYLSLEILELNGNTFTDSIKRRETEQIHKMDLVVIQDKYRLEYLEQTVGGKLGSVAFLPNSVSRGPEYKRNDFFHQMFGLPADRRILLSAGMISESVCSLAIAEVMGNWETDLPVTTVFHERMQIPANRPYYRRVEQAGRGKVMLSLKPLPFEEVHKVFSSADIGLAVYSKQYGKNFSVIGSASGKLFQYIKYGMPVIASDLPGLTELVIENDLGKVISDLSELPGAIEDILGDYHRYSMNALTAFNGKLNMDNYIEAVYREVIR